MRPAPGPPLGALTARAGGLPSPSARTHVLHRDRPLVVPFVGDPPTRAFVRLSADSAAAFPALRYDLLFPLAPGVVLIRAAGHTPGAQYVFVQLANGREVLIAADLAWRSEGLTTARQRPEATSTRLGEDRAAVQAQLEWARRIFEGGRVAIVLSHDSRLLDSLVTRGVLRRDLDLAHP